MIICETKAKNFSLQFQNKAQADQLIQQLQQQTDPAVVELADKLAHRLGTQYAHDDIEYTTVVYNTEVAILLQGYFDGLTLSLSTKHSHSDDTGKSPDEQSSSSRPSLLSKWFKK